MDPLIRKLEKYLNNWSRYKLRLLGKPALILPKTLFKKLLMRKPNLFGMHFFAGWEGSGYLPPGSAALMEPWWTCRVEYYKT